MKVLATTLLFVCVTTVLAQSDITITVPTAGAVSTSLSQCENLRVSLRVNAADWTTEICAEIMTRSGVRANLVTDLNSQVQDAVNASMSTARAAAQTTLDEFDNTDWPLPVSPVVCGDSRVDSEFGEDCDDGGVDTAACDIDCTSAVCGDDYLNEVAGEQCDDGNTDPGDGCDATCQIE